MDFHTTVLLVIAALNAAPAVVAASLSWKNHLAAKEAERVRHEIMAQVMETRKDVRTIEISANSMKDALLSATAEVKLAEGKEIGRAKERIEQGLPP